MTVEAALLVVGLAALVAAAIVVRRLTVIAARLVEVVEGLKAVRERGATAAKHPFSLRQFRPVYGIGRPATSSKFI
jgi:hypothetical protein